MTFTDKQLTEIYKRANGIEEGKAPPISTQKIFTAMRAMVEESQKLRVEQSIATMVAAGKCEPDGDVAILLRGF